MLTRKSVLVGADEAGFTGGMDQVLSAAAVLSLPVAAALLAVEWAVAGVLHPLLDRLPKPARVAARAESAERLGKIMPGWYAAALACAAACATIAALAPTTHPLVLTVWTVATLGYGIVILVTVRRLVPLNDRLAGWRGEPTATWAQTAARWDRLHHRRTVALGLLLGLLLAAALSSA